MIDSDFHTLSIKCRKQMADSALNRGIETASEVLDTSMKGSMVSSFAVNLLVAGSLSQLLGMINSLQLISHLPLLAISVPANVMTLEELLVPVVMFDIFETENMFIFTDKVLNTEL